MRASWTAVVLIWASILGTLGACQQQSFSSSNAATESNQALVRRWIEEGFNQRKLAVIQELFAEHVVINGQEVGRDRLEESMSRHLAGFPDLHVTIDEVVAEGSKVSIWYTARGTHRGEFESIPATGKNVKWIGCDLFGIENGKIAEARFLSDFHGLLTQLGAAVSLPLREK